jgi:nitrate reductase gamma subunit
MHAVYNFVAGPLLWVTAAVFLGGVLYRLVSMALLARKKDLVVYSYMDLRYALRSIMHWLAPFGSLNSRRRPVLTIVTFTFHVCLFLVPIFLFAHVVLWKQSWNVSWWYLSEATGDVLTLVVIAACLFFLVRRLVLPDVKYLSSASDFVILALVAAPFVTGFWTYHQWVGFRTMGIVHILSGEILLMAIPFTKLSHMIFFPFMRGYMGSEFGAVRHARDW